MLRSSRPVGFVAPWILFPALSLYNFEFGKTLVIVCLIYHVLMSQIAFLVGGELIDERGCSVVSLYYSGWSSWIRFLLFRHEIIHLNSSL